MSDRVPSGPLQAILDRALGGEEISEAEGTALLEAGGADLFAVAAAADRLRAVQAGPAVTYVLNRNINFTNVCTVACDFCAFSRRPGAAGGYLLSAHEVGRRAEEALAAGCSEVCLQGGLNPAVGGDYYLELCREVRRRAPGIHIHAFSPQEVFSGARTKNWAVGDYLVALKDAGLDSMPGTAAEILDDGIRRVICPGKLPVGDWVETIRTAHRLRIPTSATMLYGHVEQAGHRARHMALVREIQRDTGGFTEFVPLGFVHHRAPLYRKEGCRAGPSGPDDLRVHAVARLMLGASLRNVQVSWVKLGPKLAQLCLQAGANDLGGTLTEENITRAAAAGPDAPLLDEADLRRLAAAIGRPAARRSTTYAPAGNRP